MLRWPVALPHSLRLLMLLAALSLAACSKQSPLIIAAHGWPGYQFLFLARDEATLPPHVVLESTRDSSESVQRLRDGRAHAAGLTLDEVLRLRDEGIDLRVVLIFNISDGADMVLAQPEFTEAHQLRGQRIGVESSSLAALMLHKFLASNDLTRDDVLLETVALSDHLQAFAQRRVAALVTFQPVAGQLLAQGARELLTTREMPPLVFDVLAVQRGALEQYGTSIRAVVAAHLQALTQLRTNPVDTSYRLARYLQVDGPSVMSSLRGIALPDVYRNSELLQGTALAATTRELLEILQGLGQAGGADPLTDLFSADYLPEPL